MKKWKGLRKIGIGILMAICAFFTLLPDRSSRVARAASAWDTPASVIKINETNIDDLIDHRADGNTEISDNDGSYKAKRETYRPSDRAWQGLPSVAMTGDRLWACWYTGGTGEPRMFNYVVVAYSDDLGKHWVDPFAVIDSKTTEQENAGVTEAVCNLFVDEDGKLYITYMQSKTWAVEILHPSAENIENISFSTPYVLTNAKLHKPPTIIKDSDGKTAWGIVYDSVSGNSDVTYTTFAVSKDKGKTWTTRGKVKSSAPSIRKYPESQVVQNEKGKLTIVSRLEGGQLGGVETSVSTDYGATWSAYENNLSEPFIGPGSKGHILKLSSGHILAINHDTTIERGGLTAYLSKDGGKTFPFRLPIDPRSGDDKTGCSYPFAFEKDKKIYVVWDYGRYVQKEIRLSVFTEDDVISGGYFSASSQYKTVVSKLNSDYKEIVAINADFEKNMQFPVGTASAEIRAKLPTSFTVSMNDGATYSLTGVWKAPGYKQNVAGVYTFTFHPASLPITVEDCAERLTVHITLTKKKDGGCSSNVWLTFPSVATAVAFLVVSLKQMKGRKRI